MPKIPRAVMSDLIDSRRLIDKVYKQFVEFKSVKNIEGACKIGVDNINRYLARLVICKKTLNNIILDRINTKPKDIY